MSFGKHREKFFGRRLFVLADKFVGYDQVDAIGHAVDALVDPVEFDIQLAWRHPCRAQHPEASSLADLDDDVPAMGEGKKRELDTQHLANTIIHDSFSLVRTALTNQSAAAIVTSPRGSFNRPR